MADFATLVGTYARGFAIITEPFDERMPAVRDPVMQVLNSKLLLFSCVAMLLLFSCLAKLLLFSCVAKLLLISLFAKSRKGVRWRLSFCAS